MSKQLADELDRKCGTTGLDYVDALISNHDQITAALRAVDVDESLATQLRRSMERNAQLANENTRLRETAVLLRRALMPMASHEMGDLLLDYLQANGFPGDGIEKLQRLVDIIDKVLAETREFT